MKILVTGTGGRVGSAVARDLLEHGHSVRALDVAPPRRKLREWIAENGAHDRIETIYSDLTNRLQLLKAAEGCDAIAHLAAIANPGQRDDVIMHTNVVGTQYVLEAAEVNGIARVALASSCCAFGIFFAPREWEPLGFPVNETHPCLNQDLYGLSKVFNEQTAAAYTRKSDMTTVCLRLTTVVNLERGRHEWWRRRQLENSGQHKERDFWSYIDLRDAARAFRLALTAEISGHHTLIIAARDSLTPHNLHDLARLHFPTVPLDTDSVTPHGSFYDTSQAEEVMGFVAQHSWRDESELADITPEPLPSK